MENMEGNNVGFQQVYTENAPNYGKKETVSTGKWVGIQFIKWIPLVGQIIYLVMLFIWAFGSDNKDETFKNWAKATLIMIAIGVVITVIFTVGFGTLIASMIKSFNSGEFDSLMYQ